MKELIPGLGKTKTEKRLDELFSRKTLGAVLFGAAASKVVEKLNAVFVAAIIVIVFGVDLTTEMWLTAVLLLIWWGLELAIFIYLYIRWEHAMEELADVAGDSKDKAKDAGGKVKDKAKEKAGEVKDKAKGGDDSSKP